MSRMSRRTFTAVAAAAAIPSVFPRLARAFPLNLPPGIQLYTVRDTIESDAPAALRALAAIGYKEVETAGFGSLRTAAAFRAALDSVGLHCPSAHVVFDPDELSRAFDDANTLGCTYATASVPRALVVTKVAAGERAKPLMAPMEVEEVKRLADTLNRVGAAAKTAGLKYASHNHAFEFEPMQGQTAYDYLLAHTDPALVHFELDCGWATVAGHDPLDFVRRYPGRFKMIHMSDYLPLKPDWHKETVPPGAELGEGFVPYTKIIAGLRGRGIEHCFVEQAGPYLRMPPLQAAKKDFLFLAKFS